MIKIMFLEKVKTAVRLGIQSRSGVMGFSTGTPFWGLCFFFPLMQQNAIFGSCQLVKRKDLILFWGNSLSFR